MKTAVEWLEEHIKKVSWIDKKLSERMDIIQQAKEMEKEQIMEAYMKAKLECIDTFGLNVMKHKIINDTEQYYNETFGDTIVTEYRDGTIDVETFE
jgi:hypothetical protein